MKNIFLCHLCSVISIFFTVHGMRKNYVVFVRRSEIDKLDIPKGESHSVLNYSIEPDAACYDYSTKTIYWTERREVDYAISTVRSVHVFRRKIWMTTIGIEGNIMLSVDWMGRNLYFLNRYYDMIYACKLDGSVCIIVDGDAARATEIALDPINGEMYWSKYGENGSIIKQGMDGSFRRDIAEASYATGLALDLFTDRLYWSETYPPFTEFAIKSIRRDGTDVKVIEKEYFPRTPSTIVALKTKLLWDKKDPVYHSVIRVRNKVTSGNVSTLAVSRSPYLCFFVTDASISKKEREMMKRNPCRSSLCTHMCLIAPKQRFSCACPPGMVLQIDNTTCLRDRKESWLLVWTKNTIFLSIADYLYYTSRPQFMEKMELQNVSFITDIAYDWDHDSYFFVEAHTKVWAVSIVSGETREVVKGGIGRIHSLCYDDVGENLYWLDIKYSKIEVSSADGSLRAELVRISAFNMMIYPENGIMYVLVRSNPPYVAMLNMDGTNRRKLEGSEGTSSWTLNRFTGDLYLVNKNDNTLFKMSLNKETKGTIARNFSGDVKFIAVSKRRIYWMNNGSPNLFYSSTLDEEDEIEVFLPKILRDDEVSWQLGYVHPANNKERCRHAGCSHFCLLIPEGAKCFCAEQYVLHHDSRTCLETPKSEMSTVIFFATGAAILLILSTMVVICTRKKRTRQNGRRKDKTKKNNALKHNDEEREYLYISGNENIYEIQPNKVPKDSEEREKAQCDDVLENPYEVMKEDHRKQENKTSDKTEFGRKELLIVNDEEGYLLPNVKFKVEVSTDEVLKQSGHLENVINDIYEEEKERKPSFALGKSNRIILPNTEKVSKNEICNQTSRSLQLGNDAYLMPIVKEKTGLLTPEESNAYLSEMHEHIYEAVREQQ